MVTVLKMTETQMQEIRDLFADLSAQTKELSGRVERLEKIHSLSLSKESYSIEEVAERLKRAHFTVAQWANKGRIRAKKVHGKGPTGEWRVSADEFARLQRDGICPERTFPDNSKATLRTVA